MKNLLRSFIIPLTVIALAVVALVPGIGRYVQAQGSTGESGGSIPTAICPAFRPTVIIRGTPTLTLSYDDDKRESDLKAEFVVYVNGGSTGVNVLQFAAINFNNTTSSREWSGVSRTAKLTTASTASTTLDIYGQKMYVIAPGQALSFNVEVSSTPVQMFAGSYTANLASLYTNVPGENCGSSLSVPVNKTNSVTIVGEVSPYINSVTTPISSGDKMSINGERLIGAMGTGNVYIDNVAITVPVDGSKDGSLLFFTLPTLTVGSHSLQVKDNVKGTGDSNYVGFEVKSSSCYNFSVNLAVGSRSDDVRALQKLLVSQGFMSADDVSGYFGYRTYAAVRRYQTANGISATGFVGPETRARLNSMCSGTVNTGYIGAEFVQASETVAQGDLFDTGTFTISFRITAVNGDLYIPKGSAYYGNPMGQFIYTFDNTGTPTPMDAATVRVSGSVSSSGESEDTAEYFAIEEGMSRTFVFTATLTPKNSSMARMTLKSIPFRINSPNSPTLSDLPVDYSTGYLYLRGDTSITPPPMPNVCPAGYICQPVNGAPGDASIGCPAGFVCTVVTPTENKSPVIHGGTFPTTLNVGQAGTWEVKASDPQNKPLTYSIDWGDTYTCPAGFVCTPTQSSLYNTQDSIFTHSYASAGTYKIIITVKNSLGLSAQTRTTVTVGTPVVPTSTSITVTSPNGGENIVQRQQHSNEYSVSWSANNVSNISAFLVPADSAGNGQGSLGIIGSVSSNYSTMWWDGMTVMSDLHNGTAIRVPSGNYKVYLVGNIIGGGTVNDMSDHPFSITGIVTPDTTRKAQVRQLYLDLQHREPDQQGWDYWVNTGLSVDEMKRQMMQGIEYQTKIKIAAIFKECGKGTPSDLDYMKWYYTAEYNNYNTEVVRQGLGCSSTQVVPVPVPVTPAPIPVTRTVSESIKCVFTGATTVQHCNSAGGQYTFSGVNTAGGTVSGTYGTQITWKSSCGGYAYSTLDGQSEYAYFTCPTVVPTPVPQVKLSVTPSTITVGEMATINWASEGAVSCAGTGFRTNDATSGSQNVKLTVPTTVTYSISCVNKDGAGAKASATLNVIEVQAHIPPPAVNLLTSFSQGASYPYDTLVTSGNSITSALETTGNAGGAASNRLTLDTTKQYKLTYTLTKNSGTSPNIRFVSNGDGRSYIHLNASGGRALDHTAQAGTQSVTFTPPTATGYIEISVGTGSKTDFSISDVTLQEVATSVPTSSVYVPGVSANILEALGKLFWR